MAVGAEKPNIFNYYNYREYLSALFNYHKAVNPVLDFAANSRDADQVYQLNFQFFPLVNPDRPVRSGKRKEQGP